MSKEAMKLALEALESCDFTYTIGNGGYQQFDRPSVEKAITALSQALKDQVDDTNVVDLTASLKQEAVAWEAKTKLGFPIGSHRLIFTDKVRADEWLSEFVEGHAWLIPLYTSPPAQRQPMTDGEIKELWVSYRAAMPRYLCFARAAIAKAEQA